MKKNTITFAQASLHDIRNTSSHKGYIKTTARELTKVLGRPNHCNDKSAFQWFCKYGSVIFTVYDYRESVRPKQNTEIEYHIGTKAPEDTGIIVGLLAALGLEAYIKN